MLGCPGVHGHLLANQTLFEASLCRPTAPGLPRSGTGDFGTSPIFGQLSDKPLLARIIHQISGCVGRKHNGGLDINATKKRFLWCCVSPRIVRDDVIEWTWSFGSEDGSWLYSGECAQSVDVR